MRNLVRGSVLIVSACIFAGDAGWAQQSPKPAPPAKVSTDLGLTFATERSKVVPDSCCFWFKGGGADAAFTFWKGWGVAATVTGDHASSVTSTVIRDQRSSVDVNKISFLAGPRYTWTAWTGAKDHRLQVFGQGLFGIAHGFDGLYPSNDTLKSSANSFAVQAGGGLNYYLTKNWGLRLIEADYVRTQFPNAADDVQNDMRLAFGVTYHIDGSQPAPVTLACSASPAVVFPGDPITVTSTAGGLNPKLNAVYSFSGEGATGNGASATVATASLAPGTYSVKCGVKEGKPGKEGLKPWESADASASFTVKPFEPPTVTCSVNPGTIKPGETSTVTATGVSPQNRPLTYSYAAAAGSISGNGSTATFSSVGAPTGAAGITCTATDDKGQSATGTTSVNVLAPYVPPVPHTQTLCSLAFDKDPLRPTRVDNEAKACLDEIALDLQKQPDAKVLVVGTASAKEKAKTAKQQKAALKNKHIKVQDFAAERAVNTKAYLVTEKGIDPSRIIVATSASDDQKVEDYLVPAGASISTDVAATTPVDEAIVKAEVRKPLPQKHAHKKHAVAN